MAPEAEGGAGVEELGEEKVVAGEASGDHEGVGLGDVAEGGASAQQGEEMRERSRSGKEEG